MKIAIGADSYGYLLKNSIKEYLSNKDHEITDFGVGSPEEDTPYYVTANAVAKLVADKEFDRAVLVCGTGMGMSIIANKHSGAYAAVCETPFAAEKSRSINNSNILTLGSFITTDTMAKEIVDVWLRTTFTEGWETSMKEWLQKSMGDIASLECNQFGRDGNDSEMNE
ncbi:MAG: RpiB/LacA/LacB family sugar-phosphate isomerase [Planctomycetes bacterium]|nr:RpiB/LacA/LacB family sugar-phosphate isomerase [Planctomycetota bacterium]